MTFEEWLLSLYTYIRLEQFLVYLSISYLGVICNWYQSKMYGIIKSTLLEYWFKHYPRGSILTFVSIMSAGITLVLSGNLDTMSWPSLLALAFSSGYALDSAIDVSSDVGNQV